MKSILISIKPKWVAKILNGEKTIEVRKSNPKCDLPIDVYIYCTKDNHQLVKPKDYDKYLLFTKGAADYSHEHTLNGKVVAKFTLNSVIKCRLINDSKFDSFFHNDYQLTRKELKDYVGENDYYEWHIDNLEIFDKPKELSEFYKYTDKKIEWYSGMPKVKVMRSLTKAPQSWCYVEEL